MRKALSWGDANPEKKSYCEADEVIDPRQEQLAVTEIRRMASHWQLVLLAELAEQAQPNHARWVHARAATWSPRQADLAIKVLEALARRRAAEVRMAA